MPSPPTSGSPEKKSTRSTNSSTGWTRSRKNDLAVLIDRCLSPGFKRGVEAFGFEARLLRDVYPEDGQDVPDVQWIADAATHGFIVLTSNPAIVSVDHEIDLIRELGTKVFCIANAQHTKEGRAMIFGRHWLRIVRRSRLDGACFWRLNPNDRIAYDIP